MDLQEANKRIDFLSAQQESLGERIGVETVRIAKLRRQIEHLNEKIAEQQRIRQERTANPHAASKKRGATDRKRRAAQRKKGGGSPGAGQKEQPLSEDEVKRKIRNHEKHLAKARQSRDEQWTSNRALRDRINQLRRERVLFLTRQHEGERKVQALQVEIDEIVEMAQLYLQERGYVVEEVQQLLGEDMNEDWAFDERWQELGRNMAREQAKLDRLQAKALAQQRSQHDIAGRIESTVLTPEEEEEIRGSLRNLKERIRDEAKRYRRVKTRHHAETEAIRRLLDKMGLRDVRELVKSFGATEDQNFALFRYVQSLNEDIALMEEEQQKVETQLAVAHQKRGRASDTRDAKAGAMRDKLARMKRRTEQLAHQYRRLEGTVSDLVDLTKHAYLALSCRKKVQPGSASQHGGRAGSPTVLGVSPNSRAGSPQLATATASPGRRHSQAAQPLDVGGVDEAGRSPPRSRADAMRRKARLPLRRLSSFSRGPGVTALSDSEVDEESVLDASGEDESSEAVGAGAAGDERRGGAWQGLADGGEAGVGAEVKDTTPPRARNPLARKSGTRVTFQEAGEEGGQGAGEGEGDRDAGQPTEATGGPDDSSGAFGRPVSEAAEEVEAAPPPPSSSTPGAEGEERPSTSPEAWGREAADRGDAKGLDQSGGDASLRPATVPAEPARALVPKLSMTPHRSNKPRTASTSLMVSESNLLNYLGIVEARVGQIMEQFHARWLVYEARQRSPPSDRSAEVRKGKRASRRRGSNVKAAAATEDATSIASDKSEAPQSRRSDYLTEVESPRLTPQEPPAALPPVRGERGGGGAPARGAGRRGTGSTPASTPAPGTASSARQSVPAYRRAGPYKAVLPPDMDALSDDSGGERPMGLDELKEELDDEFSGKGAAALSQMLERKHREAAAAGRAKDGSLNRRGHNRGSNRALLMSSSKRGARRKESGKRR